MSSLVAEYFPWYAGPTMTDADLADAPWPEGLLKPYLASPWYRLGAHGIGADAVKNRLKLAAMFAAGAPVADVAAVAREAGRAAGQAVDPEAIRETLLDAWRGLHGQGIERMADGIIHTVASKKKPGKDTDASETMPSLAELSVGRFLDAPAPDTAWLLQDAIPLGMCTALAAKGGAGKTFWELQLALSVATGEDLVPGFKMAKSGKGKALLILAEEEATAIHKRHEDLLRIFFAEHEYSEEMLLRVRENLFIDTRAGKSSCIVKHGANRKVEPTRFYGEIRQRAGEIPDLKLVVIDPWTYFAPTAESDPAESTQAMALLTRLASETGAAVVVANHTRKGPNKSGSRKPCSFDLLSADELRGSSALISAVRAAIMLAPLMDHEQKLSLTSKPHDTILCGVVKNNHGVTPDTVLIQRGESGSLHFGRSLEEDEVSDAMAEAAALDQIKLILEAEEQAGRRHTPREFCRIFKPRITFRDSTVTEAKLTEILARAVVEGHLRRSKRDGDRADKIELPAYRPEAPDGTYWPGHDPDQTPVEECYEL